MPSDAPDGAGSPAAGRRPRSVSLVRSLTYFVPSYGVAIGGYLAYSVVAGRALGTAGFGYLMVILNVTALVGQLALLGVHRSGLREAASADSDDELQQLRGGARAVMLVPVPVAAAATALGVAWWRGGDPRAWAAGAMAGVLVATAAYQKISANFLRGLGHVQAASLVTGRSGGALIAVSQALCVLVVWLAVPSPGLLGVLAGTALGALVPLLWAGRVMRRSWPARPVRGRLFADLAHAARRDWKFAVSQTGGFLNTSVELWVAGALLTGHGTSLYAAGQRLAMLLNVPSSALQVVFSPALARLARGHDRERLQALVRTAATLSTSAAGVLWLPMVLAPAAVLTLVYGPDFSEAAWALALLATGLLLNAVSGLSGTTLSMAHHEGDVAVITWVAVAVRAVAGALCAWQWGVVGLAASSTAVSAMVYAATWTRARMLLHVSTHATLRPRWALLRSTAG
ncbi:lipopolysaccharide biosynthesis protein [Nocardioides sp.]|uniref:lipopolysaccharide biosynthesis protein n=1 Tax=Nocardioides sp. TaxID=35761 RepID=UPI0035278102